MLAALVDQVSNRLGSGERARPNFLEFGHKGSRIRHRHGLGVSDAGPSGNPMLLRFIGRDVVYGHALMFSRNHLT